MVDVISRICDRQRPEKNKGRYNLPNFFSWELDIPKPMVVKEVQRVPALRVFWDLEKTMLHEIRVSGTVLWSPTNANSPTYTYISQKSC